ncbi:MAG: zinc ABC transporter substrate-binding protein [Naasia sp.]
MFDVQKKLLPAALMTAAALALAGCAGTDGGAGASDELTIVASTDVWGDIASVVAGDGATVTSIIDSPDKDPHEYEATSRDQLAVSRADLVIENGGGYDSFIDTLLDASGSDAHVISAVELSGLLPEDDHAEGDHADEEHAGEDHADEEHSDDDGHGHVEGFNEHVWYDLATASATASAVAEELAELDPAGADGYRERAAGFADDISALQADAVAAGGGSEGAGVVVTEPVPLYLLEAVGLRNLTPDSFSEAVEEDSDVSPADLQTVLSLVTDGSASMLAYNEQASTGQTETVRTAAEEAGVPVVDFSETLPEGQDYLEWMTGNIEAIASALAQ